MVMENEIRLGDIMDKLTPSDRVVIYNAARQVVYRGYAANAVHGTLNPQRRIKKMGLGMETYRATEQMWDWEKTDSLPEQVPVEQFTQYRVEDLQHILIGNKYGVSDGMKAEMTLAALKGKVMLYEQDGKIYLVDSREETTGGQDNE